MQRIWWCDQCYRQHPYLYYRVINYGCQLNLFIILWSWCISKFENPYFILGM
jgi:hypothetical protein